MNDVLVDVDGRVAPLADMQTISSDADAIVMQHQRLWVLVPTSTPMCPVNGRKRAALARPKDEMAWDS